LDAIRRDDIERARRTLLAVRARQASSPCARESRFGDRRCAQRIPQLLRAKSRTFCGAGSHAMSDAPEEALADIGRRLREYGIAFALVGGLAVSIRAEVRFTRDVDLAIAMPDDSSLETLVRDLVFAEAGRTVS
jgi:hypothetical protein